jgi:thioredoxin reductase (NADPH)
MDADCIVIGGGPSGLHCGTYLSRFLWKAIVLNGARSRASWIPVSHNFPAFPEGITGFELLELLRVQTLEFGTTIKDERAVEVTGEDGNFSVKTNRSTLTAKKIIFATGVYDIPPDIPNPSHFKGNTVRHCPICDAYESRGKRTVVFGWDAHAVKVTLWLSRYSMDIALLTTGHASREDIHKWDMDAMDRHGIPLYQGRVAVIEEHGDELGDVVFEDGSRIKDIFRGYSAMGLHPNSEVAAAMGVSVDARGFINVDRKQCTNIPGVYAVGDVAGSDVGQLCVGMAHAVIASTDITNHLVEF